MLLTFLGHHYNGRNDSTAQYYYEDVPGTILKSWQCFDLYELTLRQFIWSVLIVALVGNMIATSFAGNPSIVNYDMFVGVFSLFTLFYLIPATFKESFIVHPILMITIDALNTIFYFCGGVAMAAYLRVHSCSNPVSVK